MNDDHRKLKATIAVIPYLRRSFHCLAGFLAATCFCGAATVAQEVAVPGAMHSQQSHSIAGVPSYLQNLPILSGDLLNVEIFNTPELSGQFRVDEHGQILMPLGTIVDVGGLKLNGAAEVIAAALREKKIMLAPSVTVYVEQYASAGVTILGQVRSPGDYTLLGPHSLYDALAAAGGTTDIEGSEIKISHSDDPDHPTVIPVTGTDYSPTIRKAIISPGDTIVVARAPVVYAVGDLVRQGSFPIIIGQQMTLLNLLSLTAGVNRTASVSNGAIVRTATDGSVMRIRFDYNKILRSEQANPTLQAGDVVVIPRSGLKTFATFALPQLTSAAANSVLDALLLK